MNAVIDSGSRTLLEKVLLGDAAYCAVSGGVTLLGAGVIAPLLGLDRTWIVAAVGAVVVLYALGLFLLVRGERATEGVGWTAVVLNLAWIDGTILLLLGDWLTVEPAGRWLLVLLAIGVAFFTVAGAYATWQLRRNRRSKA